MAGVVLFHHHESGPAGLHLDDCDSVDASVLYETPVLPTVTIGGVPVVPIFSRLAPGFAGEYQIDVQVPPGVASSDTVDLTVTLKGQSDTVKIAIQPGSAHPGP